MERHEFLKLYDKAVDLKVALERAPEHRKKDLQTDLNLLVEKMARGNQAKFVKMMMIIEDTYKIIERGH
jgi:hypothetical protein